MKYKSKIISLVIFCLTIHSIKGMSSDTLLKRSYTVKLAPIAMLGFRFPVLTEVKYGERFATELGIGFTIGRKQYWWETAYAKAVDKRKIGLHFQIGQRWYFKKNMHSRHYMGVLYRHGDFDSETLDKKTYLIKNQLYVRYGYKEKSGNPDVEYWIGAGFSHIYSHFASRDIIFIGNGGEFDKTDIIMPAFGFGVNIGFDI